MGVQRTFRAESRVLHRRQPRLQTSSGPLSLAVHILLADWNIEGRGVFARQVIERAGFGPRRTREVLRTGTGLCVT